MPQHSLTRGWQRDSENVSYIQTLIADGEKTVEVPVPDATVDLQISLGITILALKSLFLYSDQDVTIETNNAGTPVDTITLKAGIPLIWESTTGYFTNPLTANVTDLFITNASGSAATVTMRVLQDVTP